MLHDRAELSSSYHPGIIMLSFPVHIIQALYVGQNNCSQLCIGVFLVLHRYQLGVCHAYIYTTSQKASFIRSSTCAFSKLPLMIRGIA
jgi:hypothetical protein